MSPFAARFDAPNWIGLWTLYMREVRRFMKVYIQTVLAPIVTMLLFLAIFSLAVGRVVQTLGGVPFVEFLAPGLVMMAIVQNSFANTSSSMTMAKVQGNIVDTLMPPLTPSELTFGLVMGGVTRGLVVGVVVLAGMAIFVPFHVHAPAFVLFHAFAASLMLAVLGLMGGIWAEKFDHIAAVTNFVVTPLSFLSGTFYSIDRLHPWFQIAARFNPFFYMIDGFRYGFIGYADASLAVGIGVMTGMDIVLLLCCRRMFAVGYKLKA
jgi:ABC-2 type transport system permease protein